MAGTSKWTGLAVDLGASSGRILAGHFDGSVLQTEEVSRFENGPVQVFDTLHWDALRLWGEIQQGLAKATADLQAKGRAPASVGIDTWGVDFGLLDSQGAMLGNPVHYRDSRTDGMIDKVFGQVPREEVFAATGLQTMQLNTIFQLAALKASGSPALEQAHALLMTPDLFHYFLTGERVAEYTIASTSQLLDAKARDWAWGLIEQLGLPKRIFQQVVRPCTEIGSVLPSVRDLIGGADLRVVAVGSHDTASAVAAVPTTSETFAYLSSGTWSLFGTEVPQPVLSEQCLARNFTNEGGLEDTIRLLKNIMGLWLLQELRREWEEAGRTVDWGEMTRMAASAPAFSAFIDPDDDRFLAPGAMRPRIEAFCKDTGQTPPADDGALVRCILESLALKCRAVLEGLDELAGRKLEVLHMVGGGIQNKLLCRFTTDAIGRPVKAGPVEGTALGNLMGQLIATGELGSVAEGRQVIAASVDMDTYEPQDTAAWEEAYGRFQEVVGGP